MRVSIIAAVAANGVIGNQGALPWPRNAEDMYHFYALTKGKPVIMGRVTWESLNCRPLKDRLNIVVSQTLPNPIPGAGYRVARTLQSALLTAAQAEPNGEVMVIGGAQLYRAALPMTTRMYLTLLPKEYPGDTFFRVEADEEMWELTDFRDGASGVRFETWETIDSVDA